MKLAKQIAGKTVQDGHGYLKCTYEKEAQKWCHSARNGKHNDYSSAIFCPSLLDKDIDPTVICVGARIYIDGTGMTRESGLSIRPDWANKDNPENRLAGWARWDMNSYDQLMLEAYRDYQRNHNKNFMRVGLLGVLDTKGGFRIPICVHHHVRRTDFTVGLRRGNMDRGTQYGSFPMICGDHRPNETGDFLKDIGIVSGNPLHADIFTDRMTKVSSDFVSPIPSREYRLSHFYPVTSRPRAIRVFYGSLPDEGEMAYGAKGKASTQYHSRAI